MTMAGSLAFYKLCEEYREGVGCINCHRLSSQNDNPVDNATDLPPFNGLIIKNDGPTKIEELNIATRNWSSLPIVTFLRRKGAEAKSDLTARTSLSYLFAVTRMSQGNLCCFYVKIWDG